MPIRKIGSASLDDVPLFEQPMARGLQMQRGNEDAIAHTEQRGNSVFVDDPGRMSQPILNHEVMHKIQAKAGNFEPGQGNYDYGGIQGLQKIPSIAKLNTEQQANIPQDYTAQMAHWAKGPITPMILSQADQLNSVYARPMQQLANMAADSINTTPQPPGPPPAALTGMIKPLPQIGGPTLGIPRIGK
jgi:hypothetical protein